VINHIGGIEVESNKTIEQIEKDIQEYKYYLEEYEIPRKIVSLIEKEIENLTNRLKELQGLSQ